MCGLTGYIGASDPDVMKLWLLLMYNETRGGDATGVFINNQVIKDGEKHKKSPEFISNHNIIYDKKCKNKLFIGHTRKGSMGSGTTENAHPHIVNDDLVLVQNGTIKNIWALCAKHDVDHTGITNDSKALALLIDKVGYSILDEYIGFATLIFTRISEPNVMYVFKGASKKYDYSMSKVEEERPLFLVYDKKKEELYFSSIEDSLYAVTNNTYQVINVKSNYVYRIDYTSGKLNMKAIFKSNRGETKINVGVDSYGAKTYNENFYGRGGYEDYGHAYGNYSKVNHRYLTSKKETTTPTTTAKNPEIKKEKGDNSIIEGRYTSFDKKLIMEQLVYVKAQRYTCLSKLMHGIFHITNDGVVVENPTKGSQIYYIFHGVMIDSSVNYNLLTRQTKHNKINEDVNFALFISAFSKYPIRHSDEENTFESTIEIYYFRSKIVKNSVYRMPFSSVIDFIKENHSQPVAVGGIKNTFSNATRPVICGSKVYIDITAYDEYSLVNFNRISNVTKKENNLSIKTSKNTFNEENKVDFLSISNLISVLDEILDDVDEFYEIINVSQMICIHLYVESLLISENKSRVDINEGLKILVTTAVEKSYTVREMIQEGSTIVEEFMVEAISEFNLLKSKHTIVEIRQMYGIAEKIKEPFQDTCCLPPKPVVYNGVPDINDEKEDEEEIPETEEELADMVYEEACDNVIDVLDTIHGCINEISDIKQKKVSHINLKAFLLEFGQKLSNGLSNLWDNEEDKDKKKRVMSKQIEEINYF